MVFRIARKNEQMGWGIWKKADFQLQHKIMKINFFCKGDVKTSDGNQAHLRGKAHRGNHPCKKTWRCVNFNQNTEFLSATEKGKEFWGLTYSPTVDLGHKYSAPLKRQPDCPKKVLF